MRDKLTKIGVLTSGGDAPGMNACIRSVVRTARYQEAEVIGIHQGFQGLVDGNFVAMDSRSVSNIIQQGGTILKTARCKEFESTKGREKAYRQLKTEGVQGLVVIGGDGSIRGVEIFTREYPIPVTCVAGTIDNDLFGTDFTLGYDTATNTVIEAIDKIRDTAASHERLFFVEVMGRDSGSIALNAGIAGGAEAILLPEYPMAIDELCKLLTKGKTLRKSSMIVIISEGEINGGANHVADEVSLRMPHHDIKVTILGHMQRGGIPTSFDRVLATRLGYAATDALLQGANRVLMGIQGGQVVSTPLQDALDKKKPLHRDMLKIAKVMAI